MSGFAFTSDYCLIIGNNSDFGIWGKDFTTGCSATFEPPTPPPPSSSFGATYTFRFPPGRWSISEARLGCKIPEKMKIVGIFLNMHARDRGVLWEIGYQQWPPVILGVLKYWGSRAHSDFSGKGYFWSKTEKMKKIMVPPESLFRYLSNEYQCYGVSIVKLPIFLAFWFWWKKYTSVLEGLSCWANQQLRYLALNLCYIDDIVFPLFTFQGKYYMFIEYTAQLYRCLIPITPWCYFLLDSSTGAEWFSYFLLGIYVFCKVRFGELWLLSSLATISTFFV
jgi:hypothetical protein